jgi:hypothetical protein
MNTPVQETTVRPSMKPGQNGTPRVLLRRLLARLSARRFQRECREYDQGLERAHQQHDLRLAQTVQEIFAGCGLAQPAYSIGGGRSVRVPQVISVVPGPPVRLDIKLLPGQTPEDVAARTSAIAFHLGVAGVSVIPLPPSLVRLELLSEPVRGRRR